MTQEAAIDPRFLQLEEEEVVLTLGKGNHKATIVLTEEERVEPDFAAGEDIEADRYGVFAKRQSTTGDQSGKKASPTHGADRRDDLGLKEAAKNELEIFDIVGSGGKFYWIVDYVEATFGIFGIEKLGADIAHHINELAAGESVAYRRRNRVRFRVGIEPLHHLFCKVNAVLYTGFTDFFMGSVRAVVEIFVLFDYVVLPFEPAIEALLPAIGIPHGKEGAEFLDRRHTAYDAHHLLESWLANAHGLHDFGGDQFFILYVLSTHSCHFDNSSFHNAWLYFFIAFGNRILSNDYPQFAETPQRGNEIIAKGIALGK